MKTDYVYLFNQDAYNNPADDKKESAATLKKLVEVHQKHTDYGIISPIHLDGTGENLDKRFEVFVKGLNKEYLTDKKEELYSVEFINAAAWLLPKKTVQTIGGFNPLFFYRGEDNDYCNRVLYHGFKVGLCSNASIRHDRVERLNQEKAQYYPDLQNNLLITFLNPNVWEYKYKHLVKLYLYSIVNFFKALFTLDFKFMKESIQSTFNFLSNLSKINRIKKEIKKKKSSFLLNNK